MKKLSLLLAVLVFVVSAAACLAVDYTYEDVLTWSWEEILEAAKKEGPVSFAIWGDEAEWNQTLSVLREKYGIDVTLTVGEKNQVMNKILIEKDDPESTIDIVMLSGETVNGLLGADTLAAGTLPKIEYKDDLVAGLSARKEGVANTEGWWVPISISPSGWIFNTNFLAAEDVPQNIDELTAFIQANPGRFGMCIPEKGGTGQSQMESLIANMTGGLDQYLIAEGNVVDETLHESWSKVWEWFDANKANIAFTTGNSDSLTRLNDGELWLTTAWNSNVYNGTFVDGTLNVPYGFIVPEMGLCYSGEVLSVVKNTGKPAAALFVINWIASPEAQALNVENMGWVPSNQTVDCEINLLSPEDNARLTEWMAAVYKTQYIADFNANVLAN